MDANRTVHGLILRHLGSVAACTGLLVSPVPQARAESPVAAINREAAAADITTTPVRGGISLLAGSGGNIAVLATPQGKLLVDGGIALSRQRIASALDRLGGGPPKYVVNTHWHWDHTDSNGWLHDAGATVVAHPRTLHYLSQRVRVEDWQHTFDPVPEAARPTLLVRRAKSLVVGGEQAVVRPYVASHTDGDLSVHFVRADVLVTGDTYWNGAYPFIDHVAGGHIDGMIRAAEASLALAGENTLIVPGHGPVATRQDLVDFRDMLVAVRSRIAAMKRQGLSVDEIVAARPTKAFDARWGSFVIDPAFFTRLVYRGL